MYTFAADSEQLDGLASEINGLSQTVEGSINGAFQLLNGFPETTWSGESYDSFKTGCSAYQGAINNVPSVMRSFGTTFSEAAKGVEHLKGQVDSALSTIS